MHITSRKNFTKTLKSALVAVLLTRSCLILPSAGVYENRSNSMSMVQNRMWVLSSDTAPTLPCEPASSGSASSLAFFASEAGHLRTIPLVLNN